MKTILKHTLPIIGMGIAIDANNEYELNQCYVRFNESINLPRKSKKKVRKLISKDYQFYKMMQRYSMFNVSFDSNGDIQFKN
jgi:hypothetical protein